MNKTEGYISRVVHLTEDMCRDCYYIVSRFMGDADNFYYSASHNINNAGHIMFVDQMNRFLRGFIIGKIVSDKNGNYAKIEHLYVDGRFHRMGVGARLMEAYEAHCRNAGVRRMLVKPAPTIQAKSFYAKHGYGPCGITYMYAKELGR